MWKVINALVQKVQGGRIICGGQGRRKKVPDWALVQVGGEKGGEQSDGGSDAGGLGHIFCIVVWSMRRWVQGIEGFGQRLRGEHRRPAAIFQLSPEDALVRGSRDEPTWGGGGPPPKKMASCGPLAAPPAGARDPARTSRPPWLATPGRGAGGGPAPAGNGPIGGRGGRGLR